MGLYFDRETPHQMGLGLLSFFQEGSLGGLPILIHTHML